jgi:putative membrane protein insertion efficiency factor
VRGSILEKGLKQGVLILIRIYQCAVSPFLGPACRFYPTCSSYACESIQRFGILKGIGLASRRLIRCHPFHSGGFDPVPDRPEGPAMKGLEA